KPGATFAGATATTIRSLGSRAGSWVKFRVAGPWLGRLYPSDFGRQVVFDAPTGGRLDIDALEQALADATAEVERKGRTTITKRELQLAEKRLEWAQKRLGKEAKAAAKAEKPARVRKAIGADQGDQMTRVKQPRRSKKTAAIGTEPKREAIAETATSKNATEK